MKQLLALALLLLTSLPAAAQTADPAGSWKGAIQLPNGELAIAITLHAGDGGSWSGSIDIPAQGLRGFKLSNVAVQDRQVHFEMAEIPGKPTFEGQLSEAGDAIAGSFQQGPQSLTFALQRSAEEAAAAEAPFLPEKPVPGESLVGEWLGSLDAGPVQLRIVLTVKPTESAEEGKGRGLTATFNSVDQNAVLPVDSITLEERKVHFAIERLQGSYEGTLNADGSAIEGSWSQVGQQLPLTFHRTAEPFALKRPQNPQPPFPYDSREVTFTNEAAGIKLAGTLLLPQGEGPFPAVVFISGSGPQDRDETLMGHKPFLVLADHLARHGIASLRYDDRGAGASEGDHMGSTVGDFAADAQAAVAFLAAQPKIDRKALGILGHSEGGLTGPRVATMTPEVDFLVLLAPPGEPLEALLLRQGRDSLRVQGVADSLIERALAAQAEDLKLIEDESLSTDALIEKLRARAEARRKTFTEAELNRLQVTEAAIEQGIQLGATPWFRSVVREDPVVYLKQIKIPVLALFAGMDIQVAAGVNAEMVKASLEAAGNKDYEIQILPGLNHLFQRAETGAVAEYGAIEETIAPEALEKISAWVGKRFREP